MKKTKEECLLMNGVMAYDLGKVEKQVMKAMDDYADDAVKFISSKPMLADSAVFTKEQVIRIVAKFGSRHNTDKFLGNGETLEEAIEEVKDLIEWNA